MASFSITFFFFISFLFLVIVLASDGEGSAPKFDYSDPENWGNLDPKYEACSNGKRQSPIDIKTSDAIHDENLQPLTRNYNVYNASLQTDGLHVEVRFNVEGGLVIDGKTYKLKQMHWHTPSEHRLDGVQYAAELHQVHAAEDGTRAVVSTLLKEGAPNPVLTLVKDQLEILVGVDCKGGEIEIEIPEFDSSLLINKRSNVYYRYPGSLTTPPCDENVIWNVLAKVETISKDQVAALKAPACPPNKKNARPLQELNGRTVQKYQGNILDSK